MPSHLGTIDVLLPTPLRGSGGHRTIVANAEALARAGYRVRLHVQRQRRQADPAGKTRSWYPVELCEVHEGWPDRLPDSDGLLATAWFTATHAAGIQTDAIRMYFVQDYEPLFHPAGDLTVTAAATYSLGYPTVVIGRWLQHKLRSDHDQSAWSVPFTADLEVYRPSSAPRARQVVAVYQPEKPRRCPGLMRATLQRLLEKDIEVLTIGSTRAPRLGAGHRHLGILSVAELGQLYAESAVGLCLSASNPSRVPFEMMAAGLPFVDMHLPNTVHDFPEQACRLALPNPGSLAEAVEQVLADPGMGAAGAAYMAERPARAESEAFVAYVGDVLAGRPPAPMPDTREYRQQAVGSHAESWSPIPESSKRPFLRR